MKIETPFSTLFISTEIDQILIKVFKQFLDRKIFILVDESTKEFCFPIISSINTIKTSEVIEIKSGEENKTIESVKQVWTTLKEKGAEGN